MKRLIEYRSIVFRIFLSGLCLALLTCNGKRSCPILDYFNVSPLFKCKHDPVVIEYRVHYSNPSHFSSQLVPVTVHRGDTDQGSIISHDIQQTEIGQLGSERAFWGSITLIDVTEHTDIILVARPGNEHCHRKIEETKKVIVTDEGLLRSECGFLTYAGVSDEERLNWSYKFSIDADDYASGVRFKHIKNINHFGLEVVYNQTRTEIAPGNIATFDDAGFDPFQGEWIVRIAEDDWDSFRRDCPKIGDASDPDCRICVELALKCDSE